MAATGVYLLYRVGMELDAYPYRKWPLINLDELLVSAVHLFASDLPASYLPHQMYLIHDDYVVQNTE